MTTVRRQPALSLTEMVAVIAIIAILAAIATPRFADALARRRADAAARRVIADLAWAQRRAKTTSAGQKVTFDTAAATYQLLAVEDPDHAGEDYVVTLADEPYLATIKSVDFGGETGVKFDGYGTPSAGGSVVVQVGSHERTIVLDPDTGQASVP